MYTLFKKSNDQDAFLHDLDAKAAKRLSRFKVFAESAMLRWLVSAFFGYAFLWTAYDLFRESARQTLFQGAIFHVVFMLILAGAMFLILANKPAWKKVSLVLLGVMSISYIGSSVIHLTPPTPIVNGRVWSSSGLVTHLQTEMKAFMDEHGFSFFISNHAGARFSLQIEDVSLNLLPLILLFLLTTSSSAWLLTAKPFAGIRKRLKGLPKFYPLSGLSILLLGVLSLKSIPDERDKFSDVLWDSDTQALQEHLDYSEKFLLEAVYRTIKFDEPQKLATVLELSKKANLDLYALHIAIYFDNAALIKWLIHEKNVDVNSQSLPDAFWKLASKPRSEMPTSMTFAGGTLHHSNSAIKDAIRSYSPIATAAFMGNIDVFELLQNMGAAANFDHYLRHNPNNPMVAAIKGKQFPMLAYFFEQHVTVSQETDSQKEGKTPVDHLLNPLMVVETSNRVRNVGRYFYPSKHHHLHLAVYELLLQKGAVPAQEREVMIFANSESVRDLFLQYGTTLQDFERYGVTEFKQF
ncbi:hypothetical protein CBF23_003895 [Marinomonas agarivorans]|nr:hypothetical protein CBF23_003895 [Marinomonas agarivorans]